MSTIRINWAANLQPNKFANAPLTKILFPWSNGKPDVDKDPALLIIYNQQ